MAFFYWHGDMMILDSHPVPHLITPNTKPLQALEKIMLEKQIEIETWFRPQWQKTPAPLTSSVDLRNAGYKIAPVDTNLYPAGFNNLNPDFFPMAVQAAQNIITSSMPGCKKILLLPENHTRNPFYMESLAVLHNIFSLAGFDIRIGSLRADLTQAETITLANGKTITLNPIERKGNQIVIDEFAPCMILLNNDLSDGVPDILHKLDQWVRPSEQLGWAKRFKSNHFNLYQQVVEEFCNVIDIDPWCISAQFSTHADIDFKQKSGEEKLAQKVDQLLASIQEKYDRLNISEKPYAVVKADAGTYGMGILMVKSGDELLNLNRKQRNKMAQGKGNKKIEQVIIQEGVPTFESWQTDDAIAEPVVYMIGHHVIGGFYRVHTGKGPDENLNAPGMHFEPLAFAKACNYPQANDCQNRFYVYGVIARLAALAAARELAELEKLS